MVSPPTDSVTILLQDSKSVNNTMDLNSSPLSTSPKNNNSLLSTAPQQEESLTTSTAVQTSPKERTALSYLQMENYGFPIPSAEDEKDIFVEYSKMKSFNQNKIEKQRKRWETFIQKNTPPNADIFAGNNRLLEHLDLEDSTLKKLVRKGIPSIFRGKVWYALSGASTIRKESFYTNLLHEHQKEIQEKSLKQIEVDLDRTFPEHPFFTLESTAAKLRHILYAFYFYNPKIGYCQSMNFIVGMLLLHLDSVEEDTFWLFVSLTENYLPEDLFDNTLNGLYCECYVLEQLLRERNKTLFRHLQHLKTNSVIFATQWFMCLFLNSVPIETSLRIWDALLLENYKILYRIGLHILSVLEPKLLKATNDGEVMHAVQRSTVYFYDCRKLLKGAFGIRAFSRKAIIKYREEYIQKQQEQKMK